jgi:hypothetical protein
MKYTIYLENGWMGDTLFASNVVKNISLMGHDVILFHKWPFMTSLIDLFNIQHNEYFIDNTGYDVIKYNSRIDVFDNPLLDYAKSFNIPNIDLEAASKFYPIDKQLKEKYNVEEAKESYITYDNDWQGRTQLNIEYILSKLEEVIKVIPIGGNRFTDDPQPLIDSAKILINSKLHLGMMGGTCNLATFLNTKTITEPSHLYNFYKTNGEAHRYMGGPTLTPDTFMETFKPFPHCWADPKHIAAHPLINENEYIDLIKNNL